MNNPNIQGAIPLEGAGFVAKVKRHFDGGEYRLFNNVELIDGAIRGRRNISTVVAEGGTMVPFTNPFPFLGFLGAYTVVASTTAQMMTNGDNGYESSWAPTSLPVPAAVGSFHKIVGVFRYNSLDCWLTHKHDAATGTNTIHLYSKVTNVYASPAATTFASLTSVTLITDTSADFVFCNFFIQGERLWIVTSTKVYFSKATDPKIFAIPDGGFFDFQSQKFHFGMALKESIYLLCDNAVFHISYTTDPNTDSFARQLSDIVGGDHGCIHKDTPYFINSTGIYSITNSSVEKVMDNLFDTGGSNAYSSKITSWEDYLIVNKYSPFNYASSNLFTAVYFYNLGRRFVPGASYNDLGYNVFFINTVTGATHVLDYYDNRDGAEKGYIADIVVNPNKDFYREYNLLFMTNRFDSLAWPNYTFKAHIYKMQPPYPVFTYDLAVDSTGAIKRYKPNIAIEIDSYTPDGSEYYMKKFRSIEIMADPPSNNFEVKFAYDNKDYPAVGTPLLLDSTVVEAAGERRNPYPCRIGLNQRAKSLSIKMSTKDNNIPIVPPAIYHNLFISDIRVLWSYTQRGVEVKTPTTT